MHSHTPPETSTGDKLAAVGVAWQAWVWLAVLSVAPQARVQLGKLLCLGGKAGSGMLHSSSTRTIGIAAQATAVLVLVRKPF